MWRFEKLSQGELERDPHESEFFNIGDNTASISLVREIIQNALDAKLPSRDTVRVRFTFGKHKKTDADIYYSDLIPHIRSCGLLPPEYLTNSELPFLTIEDFETTGLDGPIKLEKLTDSDGGNYYKFWWCDGKSQKSGQSRGRWGLGKTAYHDASDLHSLWGLTIRHDDKRQLLLGKTRLKTHWYNEGRYRNYGYFAGDNYDPIETKDLIEEFRSKFSISRNGEPGFSIVIPMPVSDINPSTIIRAVIIHYFFPIMKGSLIVEINHDSSALTLNRSTLRVVAKEQDWNGSPWEGRPVDALMQFLEDAVTTPEANMISLLPPKGTPRISEQLFGDKFNEARQKFAKNELVCIKIPIKIYPKEQPEVDSYFEVYLKKDEALNKADEFYVRAGIIISEIRKLGTRKVRALLSAQDEAVCTFLGDCESPAHTDWKELTGQFKGKYNGAVSTLRFIKSSIAEIVKLLDQPPPGVERDFLQDLFFITESVVEGNKVVKPPKEIPPQLPHVFDITKIPGGLRVALSEKNLSFPIQALIEVAYDIRTGNPFSNYHPLDFDFAEGKIHINVEYGRITERTENKVRVSIEKPSFELKALGFDRHRDLIVSVKEEMQ